ncbi:hypothetical protein MCP1_3830001 [Candidatus Terasakiella magnetica]|nr:hypothetical protein MCP1_3830001 [Candidatus Terasakiella magnetica]
MDDKATPIGKFKLTRIIRDCGRGVRRVQLALVGRRRNDIYHDDAAYCGEGDCSRSAAQQS